MASLGTPEKLELIKVNLAEVLNPEILESVFAQGRSPRIYWGKSISKAKGDKACGSLG
jgi:tyrosyl-tRNA synthetase